MSAIVKPGDAILVDTMVIIEAHRKGVWHALTNSYQVETVEDCVTETQTGFQLRREEQDIDPRLLSDSLAVVHPVSERELVDLEIRIEGISLDPGEKSLWAHALGRSDDWFLCGPDRASLRCGVRLGFRERIISLEELLQNVGHRTGKLLADNYTKAWLNNSLSMIVVDEL